MSSPAFTDFCKCTYGGGEDPNLLDKCAHCEDLDRLDDMADAERLMAEEQHDCHLLDPGTAFGAGEHE